MVQTRPKWLHTVQAGKWPSITYELTWFLGYINEIFYWSARRTRTPPAKPDGCCHSQSAPHAALSAACLRYTHSPLRGVREGGHDCPRQYTFSVDCTRRPCITRTSPALVRYAVLSLSARAPSHPDPPRHLVVNTRAYSAWTNTQARYACPK